MRILLVIIASIATNCWSQTCQNKSEMRQIFGDFLNCIKSNLDSNYQNLESEFQEHNQRAVGICFAPTIDLANSKRLCVMTVQDLRHEAWSRSGPLRDCSICRTFANAAIKALLKTTEQEQSCFRRELSKAVSKEADHCLARVLGTDFPGLPDVPDFEAAGFSHQSMVLKSISDFILIKSRVSFCEERAPSRARNTDSCLAHPFVGFLSRHCLLVSNCQQQLPVECRQNFERLNGAGCRCIDDARRDLKRRIGSISRTIKETIDNSNSQPSIGSASTADRCVANVKAQLVTSTNDWLLVIGSAMTKCLKNPPNKALSLDAMLRVGCKKVISEVRRNSRTNSHKQLKAGFDFINNLIDAFIDRSKRFCKGAHCG